MRILQVTTHSSGGSYESAALLCEVLAAYGIENQLCCRPAARVSGFKRVLDRVVRRFYVSLSREPWHGTRRFLPPPQPEELDAIDVVHLHSVADWFDVPSWLETLPNNIGVVVSLHDLWHFTGGCFLYRGCNLYTGTCSPCPILKRPFNRILAKDQQRRMLQAYRHRQVQFVANSQWLADLAERSPVVRGCGGAHVITPGIDTAVFRMQNKTRCRAKFAIPEEAFVIGAGAASLTDTNKNIPWLLKQFTRLAERKNLIVLLAGEGAVEIPTGLNVRMIGGISDHEARATFYGAVDIFVSASLMETYGLTLVEAMACGTPIIAFRVGGIPEAAPEGQVGILCEPLDETAFVSGIQTLRSSPQLRHELGIVASNLVVTRNSKTHFAAEFARLYKGCVNVATTPSTGQPLQDEDEQKETKITKDFVESYDQ